MNYKEFKKFILEEPVIFNHFSIVVSISFIINCLIFPAMFFQMYKTYKTKESQDFNPIFIGLQLFGGAPEGFIGAIIGLMTSNMQQSIIGFYAMFYNSFMLYYRFFGKNGIFIKKYKKSKFLKK
tara:strand:- start:1806 stop:2177 length:372 start_codon:yes stop_codon:yes gene_type:complete